MKVAVITPFYQPRQAWLAQCHASVRAQTHPCTHFLVSDGGGENPLKDFSGQFLLLKRNHHDYGDTPRAVATMMAIGQGFDAITYLDDDNWLYPDHVERLVTLHQQTQAPVCTCARELVDLDGTHLGSCVESDGVEFNDTNCYLFTRAAYSALAAWVVKPAPLRGVGHGDFYLWRLLLQTGLKRARQPQATVAYRTTWPGHYTRHQRPVPAGAKPIDLCLRNERYRQTVLAHFQDARG